MLVDALKDRSQCPFPGVEEGRGLRSVRVVNERRQRIAVRDRALTGILGHDLPWITVTEHAPTGILDIIIEN
jgi:hypothetical protein